MPDQDSIFNKENNGGTPPQNNGNGGNSGAPDSSNQLATLLGSITNEKGEQKYKSVEDALVGLKNAQEYIPGLKETLAQKEARIAALEQTAAKVASLEEALTKLTQQQPTETKQSGPSEEDIARLVENAIHKTETVKKQRENISVVTKAISDKFGDKSETEFYSKAAELGLSKEEMNALAAKSPNAVLGLFGITDKGVPQRTGSPGGSNINTTGLKPNEKTFISRNTEVLPVGATNHEMMNEQRASAKMVEELHSKGMSINDLTNPKEYFKHFGQL